MDDTQKHQAVESLIALNKVAEGTHRLEMMPDGSFRAYLLTEDRLVTEAAVIRSSMEATLIENGEGAAANYNFWANKLRRIERALRTHYGYDKGYWSQPKTAS